VCVVPKSAGFSIPRFKTLGPPWGQMSPTDHGGTQWSSLGRSFGATPTHEGMDPDGRLYQAGVGTIHPRPQTNALDWYVKGCVKNGVVAGIVHVNDGIRLRGLHKENVISTEFSNSNC
jgi:hypothetical protein